MANRRPGSASTQRFKQMQRRPMSRIRGFVVGICWWGFNLGFVFALLVILLGGYYAYTVTGPLVERFEGKRWKVPSRVFSDTLTLLPGLSVDEIGLVDRLKRLNYRQTDGEPAEEGEYRATESRIDIFLRDFRYPWENAKGYKLRVEVGGGIIEKLVDISGDELPSAEIEPELIARFFGDQQEDRDLVRVEEVSEHLKNAIVAVEDKRFYHHFGVDPIGFTRAMVTNILHLRMVQGGSTITQQLVKNFYLTSERTFNRKAKEAAMAFVLEMIYDKDAILEAYLNEVYFAQEGSVSVCGVGQASRYYFGRDVRTLGLAESALLAGLIRSPAGYNPTTRVERAKLRRDYILERMAEDKKITETDAELAKAQEIRVLQRTPAKTIAPYFIDFLRSQLDEKYGPDILVSEGLSIFTTLDVQTQHNAEQAMLDGLETLEKENPKLVASNKPPLQGAIIVLQPQTGFIRAMVGGRDYYQSQFNRAAQAKRQVGSVFKPFVYTAGFVRSIEDPGFHLSPSTVVVDEPFSVNVPGSGLWTPGNYDDKYEGEMTVRRALEQSRNIPTVKVAIDVGIPKIIEVAHRMGIDSELPKYPSIALGSADLIPLEVAGAFGTLANEGTHAEPMAVRDIVNPEGKVLEKKPVQIAQAIPPEAAYMTTSILQGAIQRGTGRRAITMGFTHPAAGKTGTTNDFKDAWFVGYTPRLLAAVWVGFDDNRKVGLPGGSAALPIWARFMIAQFSKSRPVEFASPGKVVKKKVCLASGKLAVYDCPDVIEEEFVEGTEPTQECDMHKDSILEFFKSKTKPGGP